MKSSRINKQEGLGSAKYVEELLPGIPKDITLEEICTKLPWKALIVLSSLSHQWRELIDSRQVYDARVRALSTETLEVFCHGLGRRGLTLHSRRDNSWHELPLIPHLCDQVPMHCQYITMDGKVYVIGGEKNPGNEAASVEVFVLDVAGRKGWEQCASMQHPRLGFGCGISDGKIYVFGGWNQGRMVRKSEVYDPQVNAWSPIRPELSWMDGKVVSTIAEELGEELGEEFGEEFREEFGEEHEREFGGERFPSLTMVLTEMLWSGTLVPVEMRVGQIGRKWMPLTLDRSLTL